jgi:hypothetical protein
MAKRLPIDEACAGSAADLWADYTAARAAAGDLAAIRRAMPLALSADEEGRLARCRRARAALGAQVCGWLQHGGELWARPGGLLEDLKPVPASAARGLEFDFEQRTAVGDGLPRLYDLRVRLPAVPVKRWRKPPSQTAIKAAAREVAKTYQPSDPPTAAAWKAALEEQLGDLVTREVARAALPLQLQRRRGQKRNRRK